MIKKQADRLDKINIQINKMIKQYDINKIDQIDQTLIKCVGNNISNMFCVNIQCDQPNPFYCNLIKCPCYSQHKKCLKGNTNHILDKIKQKIIQTQDLKKYVDQAIQKQIVRLSDFKQNLYKLMDDKFRFILFDKLEKSFYDVYRDKQKLQAMTSQTLKKLWKIENGQNSQNGQNKKQFNCLQFFTQKMNKLNKNLAILLDDITNDFNANAKKLQLNYGKLPLIQQSSIITQYTVYRKLKDLFPQGVHQMKLLFKASQYNFDLPSYFQTCGDQQDTVIICINQQNRILGGYFEQNFNPIQNQIQDTYYTDNQTSFLFSFSLTQNKKYQINQNRNAIKCRVDNKTCIQFADSFAIFHHANQSNKSYLSFKHKNYNFKPYQSNRQDYLKVTGTQNGQFIIKQWEVYKVIF